MANIALNAEEWKTVERFPNYEISNFGRVRSKKRMLAGSINGGALFVALGKPSRKVTVARLVAEAFCAEKPIRSVVRFKDGNRLNVRAENIFWGKKIAPPNRYVGRDVNGDFWANVDKSGDCWVWTGTVNPGGYGRFNALGRQMMATHFALITQGAEPPVHPYVVCHTCDNPPCVRPDHLFIGTRLDNKRDQIAKNRLPAPAPKFGAENPQAKLTDDLVRMIRASSESGPTLAKKLGVAASTICDARSGRKWGHVA